MLAYLPDELLSCILYVTDIKSLLTFATTCNRILSLYCGMSAENLCVIASGCTPEFVSYFRERIIKDGWRKCTRMFSTHSVVRSIPVESIFPSGADTVVEPRETSTYHVSPIRRGEMLPHRPLIAKDLTSGPSVAPQHTTSSSVIFSTDIWEETGVSLWCLHENMSMTSVSIPCTPVSFSCRSGKLMVGGDDGVTYSTMYQEQSSLTADAVLESAGGFPILHYVSGRRQYAQGSLELIDGVLTLEPVGVGIARISWPALGRFKSFSMLGNTLLLLPHEHAGW